MTNALANEIERIDELVKWATRPDRLIKNNTQLADRMKIAWPLFKAALRSAEEVGRLREALKGLLVAVEYAAPPKRFGGSDNRPNMCFEARIPIAFVTEARAALAPTETR